MKNNILLKISSLALAVLISGCQLASDSDDSDDLLVENDEAVLADRVTYTDETIEITGDTTGDEPLTKALLKPKKSADITLTLVAEIESPSYAGEVLQATEIRIHGSKAYVSYNNSGEVFRGGVEVFDISDGTKPELISSAVFTDVDVNGVSIHGDKLYLASASGSESYDSPAVLQVVTLEGGKLTDNIEVVDLPSFAATDVDSLGNLVYVTSGADDGVVSVLNRDDLSEAASHSLEDARSVDSQNVDIAVIAGSNGDPDSAAKLLTFDKDLGDVIGEFELTGATIKHSKSTIEVKKDKAILAMGDGGMQVVCLADGALIKQIDNPVVEGLDATETVTNAATAYKRSVFIANGEAGVYVAIDDENLDSKGCEVDNLVSAGKLALNDLLVDGEGERQSVNHIVYRQDLLFIAAGRGGLKVISVDDAVADDDSDDD